MAQRGSTESGRPADEETMGQTLFDKIWAAHVITERPDGTALLFVDRHLVHDGTAQAFDQIREEGLSVRRPELTFGTADHYVATRIDSNRDPVHDQMVKALADNAREYGIESYDFRDPRQGIVHVAGPELGLTLPGTILVCGDSHTSTHGALGTLAFGVGTSEVAHVLATQALWQRRPRTMRITVEGDLPLYVTAKDMILTIIGSIGANGGSGHVIEYAGSAVRNLSMEGRLTLCNMSIEAGARAGMVAPDETTFAYLAERPYAPQGADFERAVAYWRSLATDDDARFDREVHLRAADIAPTVTWGTSPETALPVTGRIPRAEDVAEERRQQFRDSLAYMGLSPGTLLQEIEVDRVFIGSCTNSRIEDLRAAADIARRGRARVPTVVVPGSWQVRNEAEQEGLDRVFRDAGFEWREPGCSMCVAMNGDSVPPGERCASTSNRNFAGRQGRGSRTHLMSPAMAAAAAITGRLTDVRTLAR